MLGCSNRRPRFISMPILHFRLMASRWALLLVYSMIGDYYVAVEVNRVPINPVLHLVLETTGCHTKNVSDGCRRLAARLDQAS